jgi:hypothetical protein
MTASSPDWRVIRVMVFDDRPDCLLLYVPERVELAIPKVTAPFTKKNLLEAFQGQNVRITEAPNAGRWDTSVLAAKKAEKAERGQKQKLAEATQATFLRNGTPLARTRAEAIEQKHQVDERIRGLQAELGEARSRARTTGDYLPVAVFRERENRLAALKLESQALQAQMGVLREKEKAENRAAHRDALEAFQKAAYRMLPRETFDNIIEAALEDDEDQAPVRQVPMEEEH